jgi:predicted metal-dependent hydrolase
MAAYELSVPDVGSVRVQKKRGMRSIRLRVTPKGELVVSAPWYVSRPLIEKFLFERKEWMNKHVEKRRTIYYDGMHFGRNMQLQIFFTPGKSKSRILADTIQVFLAEEYNPEDDLQQQVIEKKMVRALQLEAESILLPKLYEASQFMNFSFNQGNIRNLTGRWGSCDQKKNITLSLYLVQLPDALINYVIVHELAHTKHMNHSTDFWAEVARYCPDYRLLRKNLKEHDPRITERV